MAELSVIASGPLVSVQDAGRFGLMRWGVPASGPMDRTAHLAANLALGNAPGAAAIEVSRGGLVLECAGGDLSVATAGGAFRVDIDGTALPPWGVASLRQGQRLSLRPGFWGNWAYIALAGQIQGEEWLSSRATHAASGLGGGMLRAGDRLEVAEAELRDARVGPFPCPVTARPRHGFRVVMGPQDEAFTPDARAAFLSQPFRLTDAGDRMGVRLAGPSLALAVPLDLPSQPILRGSVQVAGDGVATVLLADHQTTGGYPRIATVIDADIDRFAQLRPHDRVAFRAVTADAAVAHARATAAARASWTARLAAGRPPGSGASG